MFGPEKKKNTSENLASLLLFWVKKQNRPQTTFVKAAGWMEAHAREGETRFLTLDPLLGGAECDVGGAEV